LSEEQLEAHIQYEAKLLGLKLAGDQTAKELSDSMTNQYKFLEGREERGANGIGQASAALGMCFGLGLRV